MLASGAPHVELHKRLCVCVFVCVMCIYILNMHTIYTHKQVSELFDVCAIRPAARVKQHAAGATSSRRVRAASVRPHKLVA
jgi:hypothetical protein